MVITLWKVVAWHDIASAQSLLMHVCSCLRVDVLSVLQIVILNCILFHVVIALHFGAFMQYGIWHRSHVLLLLQLFLTAFLVKSLV